MAKKPKKPNGIDIVIDEVEFADHCEQRDSDIREFFMGALIASNDASAMFPQDERDGMAVYCLVELERSIVRMEHYLAHHAPNKVSNQQRVEKYKEEYVLFGKKLRDQFGANFDRIYQSVKDEENQCARSNLDTTGGMIYDYVLPKFNQDGTHEPWGEKDVPWGRQ